MHNLAKTNHDRAFSATQFAVLENEHDHVWSIRLLFKFHCSRFSCAMIFNREVIHYFSTKNIIDQYLQNFPMKHSEDLKRGTSDIHRKTAVFRLTWRSSEMYKLYKILKGLRWQGHWHIAYLWETSGIWKKS